MIGADHRGDELIVENLTKHDVWISDTGCVRERRPSDALGLGGAHEGGNGPGLTLVPLERRSVPAGDQLDSFSRNLQTSDDVRVRWGEAGGSQQGVLWSLAGAVLVTIGLVSAIVLTIILARGDFARWRLALAVVGVVLPFALLRELARRRGEESLERFHHAASLAAVVGFAFLLLPVVMGWSTDFALYWDPESAPDDQALIYMWARLVQMCVIIALTLLPAMMFYVFDRRRGPVIRARMTQALFRLEPGFRTLRDVEATYGERLDDLGGSPSVPGKAHRPRHRSMVVIATVFIGGGWVITLTNGDVQRAPGESFSSYIHALLTPEATLPAFAFLGAYLFSILLVVRSYLRSDLQPKTYGLITARIAVVLVLGRLLPRVFGGEEDWTFLAAFLVGVVPSEFLRMVGNIVTAFSIAAGRRFRLGSVLHEREPLTSIHGLDLYDQTRLEMEGVNNVEALAHADLVELMFETRIPPERIVDWMDQAVLATRIPVVKESRADHSPPHSPDLRENLRYYGVRTATDLDGAVHAVAEQLPDDARRIELIARTMHDEEWMQQLRNWRRSSSMLIRDVPGSGSYDPDGAGPWQESTAGFGYDVGGPGAGVDDGPDRWQESAAGFGYDVGEPSGAVDDEADRWGESGAGVGDDVGEPGGAVDDEADRWGESGAGVGYDVGESGAAIDHDPDRSGQDTAV